MQRPVRRRQAHADQLQTNRYLRDRGAGNFAHPGDLHLVAMQGGAVLGNDQQRDASAAALQFVDKTAQITEQALGAQPVIG